MAHLTSTDGDIEAPPDRRAHDLLLILRLNAFYFQLASALTLSRRQHGDHLIDLLGNGFAMMLAIGCAGLASRWPWIRFPPILGKRSCLSFAGPLSFLQLSLQPLVLFPFPFPMQPFLLLPQLLLFPLQLLLSPSQLLVLLAQSLILQTSATPLLLQ